MKKHFINISLIGLLMLVLGSGCKKFLDQPVNGAFDEELFYKTDQDAMQAINATYDMMQAHYNNNWGSIYMVKMMLSDEGNAGGSDAGDQPGYQTLDNFTFDATNDKIRDAWRMSYFTIYRANKIVNRVLPETDLRKRIIAEAKFIRAYNYFELVTLWGDVPLVLDDIAPASYTSTGRKPKADIYAQIEKDLTEAIAGLPLKSTYTGADRFHVSKGSAQAMLGKTLLFEQKYAEAAIQFEAVITSTQYALAPSVGAAFSRNFEFGPESIFEVNYTSTRSYDWGNFPWGGAPESNIHIQLMGPRADYYVKAPTDSLIGGWGFNLPRQKMWDAFVAAGDVTRRQQTILSQTDLVAAGGAWNVTNAYDFSGYWQRKYGTFIPQTGGPVGELNYGTNWRHIRYADVLLMAAEAYNKSSNDPKARGYLNQVRTTHAGLPDINSSGATLFEDIVKERQLELAFEGMRFQDLIRWGKATAELGPLGFQTKHALLPIPDFDVRSASLSQNTGW